MSNVLATVGNPKSLSAYFEQPGVLASLAKSASGNIDPQLVAKIVCRIAADPKNRKLLDCTMASLFTSVSECVSLGLKPQLGRAYFIPYGKECTFLIGYQGMLDLARKCGVTATVHAVFDGDEFLFEEGTEERIVHRPNLDAERTEKNFKYAYVVTRLNDGTIFHTVMTKPEIDSIRKRSKASDNGPWKTDYVEMAKKTVVRRAAKNWPMSDDTMTAIERDDARTVGQTTFDITAGVKTSATEKLRERIIANSQTASADEGIDVDFDYVDVENETVEQKKA